MSARLLQLPTGGSIGMTTLGDPAAEFSVLLCHPAPGAAGFDPDPVVTAERSARLLSADRPGYGASDPQESALADPHLAELAVLDELSSAGSRVGAVVGWGFGGLVALSLAAARPDVVERVALVQTPAPGSRLYDVVARRARAWSLQHRDPLLARASLLGGTGIRALSLLGASPEDEALRLPGLAERCERMLADAVGVGEAGLAFDRRAQHRRHWPDVARAVQVPVLALYGRRDPRLDARDPRWFVRHLDRVQVEVVDEAGPLAIASEWARILDFVRGRARDA